MRCVSWVFHGSLDLSRGCVGCRGSGLPSCRGFGGAAPRSPCPALLPFVVLPWFAWQGGARPGSGGWRGAGCMGCGGEVCVPVQPPEPRHWQGERCGRAAQKAVPPKRGCGGVTSPSPGARPLSQGNAGVRSQPQDLLGEHLSRLRLPCGVCLLGVSACPSCLAGTCRLPALPALPARCDSQGTDGAGWQGGGQSSNAKAYACSRRFGFKH